MNNVSIVPANPDEIAMTLTVTAKLKEWKEIREQLQDQPREYNGAWAFAGVIGQLVDKASDHFYPTIEPPKET